MMGRRQMNQLKSQLNRLNVLQLSLFLLILGLFLGILCANVFKVNYITQIRNFKTDIFPRIVGNDIDYMGLFLYILGNNLRDFFIYWLLCITILGIPYIAYKITSFGFFTGFLISALTLEYGVKGLLLVIVYVFPHGILYLPVGLISLYKGYRLCSFIYRDNRANIKVIARELRANIGLILILALALLVASFLEAFPGAYLLKKTLGLFT